MCVTIICHKEVSKMVTVSWIAHGIVIVDAGEPHIRYLSSDFLRDAGIPAEAEGLVRTIFTGFNAVHLELQFNDRWEAVANLDVEGRVVPRFGEGGTLLEALESLMNDITVDVHIS
jgi:hypothetical protein